MNQVTLAAYNLPLIRDVGFMKDKEGIHQHPQRIMEKINVFVYVKTGLIKVIEAGHEYHLAEGTYLFLRKNRPHWGEECYAPGTEWYYIHFYDAPSPLEKQNEFSHFPQSTMILEETYQTKISLPKCSKVIHPEYTELQLSKLLSQYDTPSSTRPLRLSMMVYDFFIELYRHKQEENKNKKSQRLVYQLIKLLQSSIPKKLSGKEISDHMGMNYTYLSTLFRQQTGKSINQYQNELVVEKAIHLLRENSLTIAEVSNLLGFSNPFYFSRVFKKVTGVAPSTYLNQNYRG